MAQAYWKKYKELGVSTEVEISVTVGANGETGLEFNMGQFNIWGLDFGVLEAVYVKISYCI